jgi:gliding motility-associated-like protein
MRDFIELRCSVINEGMVDCYDIEGPYPITVMVDPPASGNVQFNGLDLQNYPWIGVYFSGLTYTMEATPNQFYVFDYWEVMNSTVSPDSSETNVSFSILEGDTVIAHFIPLESNTIILNVVPPEAGNIVLDNIATTVFPAYQDIYSQVEYEVSTNPSEFYYAFDHWELANGSLTPYPSLSVVDISISDLDTLTAYYNVLEHFSATIIVEPEYSGNVEMDGITIPYFPYIHNYLIVDTISLIATPIEKFEFETYQTNQSELLQDPTININQVVLTSNDTIYVVFEKEKFSFYVPNSFSPNGDGKNDIWRPIGSAVDVSEYLLEIFSRDGRLLFKTDDFNEGWNGSVNGGQYYVMDGVYVYRMYYKSSVSRDFESVSGTITVVR